MIRKRFFPDRWARITVWTGAAIAWVTSVLVVQAEHPVAADLPPPVPPPTQVPASTTVLAPVPDALDEGLVVLRFTPTPPPPPEVITRTVMVGGSGGGGGSGPQSPAPEPIVSSGS